MAFIDLENAADSKVSTPTDGCVIGSRAAGRVGKATRYIAMSIGANAAKAIGLTMAVHPMRVQAGAGEDTGKLAVMCDGKGKFMAKRQTAGHYLLTVSSGAVGGRFSTNFPKFSIEKARIIPGGPGRPSMMIVACSPEMCGVA